MPPQITPFWHKDYFEKVQTQEKLLNRVVMPLYKGINIYIKDTSICRHPLLCTRKRKKVKSLSCVRLFATPWTVTHQTFPPWNFLGNSTKVGFHFLLQGIFLAQGSNWILLYWQAGSLLLSHQGNPFSPYFQLNGWCVLESRKHEISLFFPVNIHQQLSLRPERILLAWTPAHISSLKKCRLSHQRHPGSIPASGRSPGEWIGYPFQYSWASLVTQTVKNPPAMRET